MPPSVELIGLGSTTPQISSQIDASVVCDDLRKTFFKQTSLGLRRPIALSIERSFQIARHVVQIPGSLVAMFYSNLRTILSSLCNSPRVFRYLLEIMVPGIHLGLQLLVPSVWNSLYLLIFTTSLRDCLSF